MSVRTDKIQLQLIIDGKVAASNMKEVRDALKVAKSELDRLNLGSAEYNEQMKKVKGLQGILSEHNNQLKGMSAAWQNIKQQIISFGIMAAGYLGFQFLTSQLSNFIKKQGEMSDQLAEIQKTTGLTTKEVNELSAALGKINTRTSSSSLRDIAIAAGQLGISKNDIVAFTAATDKLYVVMGKEFQGTATDVANGLGKLRNVFSDIKSDDISTDMLHIGNALNVLAQSGVATGPVMADFANRIGGIGISLGLTTGQVLGLSATLQELNVSEERGGTAVGKILKAMTLHIKEFADVAGMSMNGFSDLVNHDLYGAFLKVVEGSQKTANSATTLSDMLDRLHIDGSGASEVFAKLSNNMKMLDEKTKMASTSLKSTDSIMTQFAIQNNTVGASLDKIEKKIYAAAMSISGSFTQSFITLGNAMFGIKTAGEEVVQSLQQEREQLALTTLKIYDANTKQEDRIRLIDELKKKYPEYLQNINSDTVSNSELFSALQKVNDQLINRIIIQKQQNKIDAQAEEVANQRMGDFHQQSILMKEITEAVNKYGYVLKDNLTTQQQAAAALEHLNKVAETAIEPGENLGRLIVRLDGDISDYKDGLVITASAEDKLNKIMSKKDELMKQLGISTTTTTTTTTEATGATESLTEKLSRLKEMLVALPKDSPFVKLFQDSIKSTEASIAAQDKEGNSIDALKAKVKELKKEWGAAALGSELKDNLKAQLDQAIKDLNEALGKSDKKMESLKNKIGDLYAELDAAGMESQSKEIAAANHKYDELLKLAKGNTKEMAQIEELSAKALSNIADKYQKKYEKALIDAMADGKEKEKALDALAYREELFQYGIHLDDMLNLTKVQQSLLLELTEKHRKNLLDIDKKYLLKTRKVNTDWINEWVHKEAAAEDKILQKREQTLEATASVVTQVGALFEQSAQSQIDNEKLSGSERTMAAEHLKEVKLAEAGILLAITLLEDGLSFNWIKFAKDAALGALEIGAIAGTQIPHYAEGEVTRHPHIAMVGEDAPRYPEYIIPTNPAYRSRAMDLLADVSQILQPFQFTPQPVINTSYVTNTSGSQNSIDTQLMKSMMQKIIITQDKLNRKLDEGLNAKLNYDQFNREMKRINTVKNDAKVSN